MRIRILAFAGKSTAHTLNAIQHNEMKQTRAKSTHRAKWGMFTRFGHKQTLAQFARNAHTDDGGSCNKRETHTKACNKSGYRIRLNIHTLITNLWAYFIYYLC